MVHGRRPSAGCSPEQRALIEMATEQAHAGSRGTDAIANTLSASAEGKAAKNTLLAWTTAS